MIIYKDKNGKMRNGYFPKISAEAENETVIDRFPGTHASCSLLANLVFNKYYLMNKALNYMKSFWNQLILYLKDGRYNIDNSLAERMLV